MLCTKITCKDWWKVCVESTYFVKLSTDKLPNGKTIQRKAGTQIVDRAWRFIKDRLRLSHAATTVGSTILRAQIRGAQYEYWKRTKDMWLCAGELLT